MGNFNRYIIILKFIFKYFYNNNSTQFLKILSANFARFVLLDIRIDY
jgi:hypothetical protein